MSTLKTVPGPRGPSAKGRTDRRGLALAGAARPWQSSGSSRLSRGVPSSLRLCPAPAEDDLSFLSVSTHTLPGKMTSFLLRLLAPPPL